VHAQVPVRLIRLVAPSVFPLRLQVMDAFWEVPVDILLFHVAIPFTIAHLNLRSAMPP
jgi:hypothetical protein